MCRTCITSSPPTCQYPSEKAHTVQRAQTVASRALQPSPIKQPGLSPCITMRTHTCLCGFRGGESRPSKLLVFTCTVCVCQVVCACYVWDFFSGSKRIAVWSRPDGGGGHSWQQWLWQAVLELCQVADTLLFMASCLDGESVEPFEDERLFTFKPLRQCHSLYSRRGGGGIGEGGGWHKVLRMQSCSWEA